MIKTHCDGCGRIISENSRYKINVSSISIAGIQEYASDLNFHDVPCLEKYITKEVHLVDKARAEMKVTESGD